MLKEEEFCGYICQGAENQFLSLDTAMKSASFCPCRGRTGYNKSQLSSNYHGTFCSLVLGTEYASTRAYTMEITLFLVVWDSQLKTSLPATFWLCIFMLSVYIYQIYQWQCQWEQRCFTSLEPTWSFGHKQHNMFLSEYSVGVARDILPCRAGGTQRQFLPLW